MLIHAASRATGDYDTEPHRWTVEADTYEAGRAEIDAAVPEGWTLLYVRVDRAA